MKKTTFAAGLCASALSLALLPSMHSIAERNQMLTWEKTGKNSVRLKRKLQAQDFLRYRPGNDEKQHRKRNRAAGNQVQVRLISSGSVHIFPAVLK